MNHHHYLLLLLLIHLLLSLLILFFSPISSINSSHSSSEILHKKKPEITSFNTSLPTYPPFLSYTPFKKIINYILSTHLPHSTVSYNHLRSPISSLIFSFFFENSSSDSEESEISTIPQLFISQQKNTRSFSFPGTFFSPLSVLPKRSDSPTSIISDTCSNFSLSSLSSDSSSLSSSSSESSLSSYESFPNSCDNSSDKCEKNNLIFTVGDYISQLNNENEYDKIGFNTSKQKKKKTKNLFCGERLTSTTPIMPSSFFSKVHHSPSSTPSSSRSSSSSPS
jgi:hypothetical protein